MNYQLVANLVATHHHLQREEAEEVAEEVAEAAAEAEDGEGSADLVLISSTAADDHHGQSARRGEVSSCGIFHNQSEPIGHCASDRASLMVRHSAASSLSS